MSLDEALEKHMKKLHMPDPPQDKEKNLILSLQGVNRTLHKRIEELERIEAGLLTEAVERTRRIQELEAELESMLEHADDGCEDCKRARAVLEKKG